MALVAMYILAAAILIALVLVARRIAIHPAPAEGSEFADISFDPSRYRAMQRLLSDDDSRFVASALHSPRAARQARTERKRLFKRYLKNLETDFVRLHSSARALLVDAPEDRPEFAQALMAQQWAFKRAMFETRMRLIAPVLGDAAEGVGRMLDAADTMIATGQAVAADRRFQPVTL